MGRGFNSKSWEIELSTEIQECQFWPSVEKKQEPKGMTRKCAIFFSLYINEKFPYDSTNISKPNWVDIKQVMKMKFLLPEFSLNKNSKMTF